MNMWGLQHFQKVPTLSCSALWQFSCSGSSNCDKALKAKMFIVQTVCQTTATATVYRWGVMLRSYWVAPLTRPQKCSIYISGRCKMLHAVGRKYLLTRKMLQTCAELSHIDCNPGFVFTHPACKSIIHWSVLLLSGPMEINSMHRWNTTTLVAGMSVM